MATRLYKAPRQQLHFGLIPAFLCCILLSYFVSFVYGMFIALSPLLYINFLITTAFGLTIGYGVRIISKLFKILDRKVIISLSIATALFGIYFSWVAFALYFVADVSVIEAYFTEFLLVFQPLLLFDIMVEMNTQGLWQIFGIPFFGAILTVVWVIEAGIIMYMPFQLAFKQKLAPFSKTQNRWYKKHVLEKDFASIFRKKSFLDAIHTDCVSAINALDTGKATRFARVSVFYLKDEKQQYISVENIYRSRNGKKEDPTDVIHLLQINSTEARTLIETYRGKEAFIFDY